MLDDKSLVGRGWGGGGGGRKAKKKEGMKEKNQLFTENVHRPKEDEDLERQLCFFFFSVSESSQRTI